MISGLINPQDVKRSEVCKLAQADFHTTYSSLQLTAQPTYPLQQGCVFKLSMLCAHRTVRRPPTANLEMWQLKTACIKNLTGSLSPLYPYTHDSYTDMHSTPAPVCSVFNFIQVTPVCCLSISVFPSLYDVVCFSPCHVSYASSC